MQTRSRISFGVDRAVRIKVIADLNHVVLEVLSCGMCWLIGTVLSVLRMIDYTLDVSLYN